MTLFLHRSESRLSFPRLFVKATAFGTASVVILGVIFTATPIALAALATTRRAWRKRNDNQQDDKQSERSAGSNHTALFIGRVWHTRFRPTGHSFTYPMMMFALDLQELPQVVDSLWPLMPLCMSWSESDHLKNGEGLLVLPQEQNVHGHSSLAVDNSLLSRVLRLVAQRTQNAFIPTKSTHRVVLLTNLKYFGYGFNPVSFYYIINKCTHTVDAIVGEVSNTPWIEMQCYVLHPKSIDQVYVLATKSDATARPTTLLDSPPRTSLKNAVRYLFPKTFHVSPFMEMNYWYDWTFSPKNMKLATSDFEAESAAHNDDLHEPFIKHTPSLRITTAMRVKAQGDDCDRNKDKHDIKHYGPLQFTATLHLTQRYPLLEPYHVPLTVMAPTLITFPLFGLLTQAWIHYQAALLYFVKRVPFIPHPSSEANADGDNMNWATWAIGAVVGTIDALVQSCQRQGEA